MTVIPFNGPKRKPPLSRVAVGLLQGLYDSGQRVQLVGDRWEYIGAEIEGEVDGDAVRELIAAGFLAPDGRVL